MPTFLILQTTYDTIQIGLFSGTQLLGFVIEDKHHVSAQLLTSLDALLKAHGHTVASIDSIAATCGPAPFTSLRTVLTCVNALAYVRHIPLIALDGIQLLLTEYHNQQYPYTVALFNAFNKELYYGLYSPDGHLHTGYAPYQDIIQLIDRTFSSAGTIRCIGNGVALYADELKQQLGSRVYIPDTIPTINTLQFLGDFVACTDRTQQVVEQLFPMFLKKIV
jgi:tRNA threonylcarbamoyl adenosine modification protein YeaZ